MYTAASRYNIKTRGKPPCTSSFRMRKQSPRNFEKRLPAAPVGERSRCREAACRGLAKEASRYKSKHQRGSGDEEAPAAKPRTLSFGVESQPVQRSRRRKLSAQILTLSPIRLASVKRETPLTGFSVAASQCCGFSAAASPLRAVGFSFSKLPVRTRLLSPPSLQRLLLPTGCDSSLLRQP
jgi:hypothetical protein